MSRRDWALNERTGRRGARGQVMRSLSEQFDAFRLVKLRGRVVWRWPDGDVIYICASKPRLRDSAEHGLRETTEGLCCQRCMRGSA